MGMKVRPRCKLVQDFFKRKIEIPTDWDYPKFSKVVKVNPPTKLTTKSSKYVPMDAVDTEKPHVNYFEERLVKENSNLPKFQQNDILFARITPSTENGKTAIIENFTGQGIASSELTVLRPIEKIIPRYLYYYVKSYRIRQFAISQMMGTTGRQRVPDYVFKKDLNFELPSLKEQQKIVSILSNVDNLIDLYDKVIETSKKLKTGLMQKLLTKGIGHTKFKKVKWYFGKEIEIPEEWELIEFEKICNKITKGIFDISPDNYALSGVPLLRISDIENNELNFSSTKFLQSEKSNEFEYSQLTEGDIVLAKVGASAGSTEKIAIVPKSVKVCNISQNLIGIKLNQKKCSPYFILLVLSTQKFMNVVISRSNTTTFKSIQLGVLRKLLIPFPGYDEQQKISFILKNIDSRIFELVSKKSRLEILKKGLMQKLLTGQIRVH